MVPIATRRNISVGSATAHTRLLDSLVEIIGEVVPADQVEKLGPDDRSARLPANLRDEQLDPVMAALPKKTRISTSTTACVIPEIGVLPPLLTFVAVRAIAPVAGMPPKRTDPMFATPWATSSMFDLCLPPVIPSATTAESRDSIAASRAIVSAGETSWLT
jgi:hypothetical protein